MPCIASDSALFFTYELIQQNFINAVTHNSLSFFLMHSTYSQGFVFVTMTMQLIKKTKNKNHLLLL